jgi:hypothetical protein
VSKVLVQNWLDKLAHTATNGNVDAHLELISQQINIVDIEKKQCLDYSDWAEYCRQRYQADSQVLVEYRDIRIKTMTPARVKFVATETVEAPDQVDRRGTEFIIQREDDGIWRAVQERLLPLTESAG